MGHFYSRMIAKGVIPLLIGFFPGSLAWVSFFMIFAEMEYEIIVYIHHRDDFLGILRGTSGVGRLLMHPRRRGNSMLCFQQSCWRKGEGLGEDALGKNDIRILQVAGRWIVPSRHIQWPRALSERLGYDS